MLTEIWTAVRGELRSSRVKLPLALFVLAAILSLMLDKATVSSERLMFRSFLSSSHHWILNFFIVFYAISYVSQFRDSRVLDLFVHKGWGPGRVFVFFFTSLFTIGFAMLVASVAISVATFVFYEETLGVGFWWYQSFRSVQLFCLLSLSLFLIRYLSSWVSGFAAFGVYFFLENLTNFERFVNDSRDPFYQFFGKAILLVLPDMSYGNPLEDWVFQLPVRTGDLWMTLAQAFVWGVLFFLFSMRSRKLWMS